MPHWAVVGMMLVMLAAYIFICHYLGAELQLGYDEDQRVLIRSALYVIAIVTFPITNLLRHIMLRLNQTMPGDTPAKHRYFVTVLVSLSLAESIGVFGFIMFILGDGYNTLYIFSVLCALAIFLYRPKLQEYCEMVETLKFKGDC